MILNHVCFCSMPYLYSEGMGDGGDGSGGENRRTSRSVPPFEFVSPRWSVKVGEARLEATRRVFGSFQTPSEKQVAPPHQWGGAFPLNDRF